MDPERDKLRREMRKRHTTHQGDGSYQVGHTPDTTALLQQLLEEERHQTQLLQEITNKLSREGPDVR